MLYLHSRWIPTLFVVETILVHQLSTLHAMCEFTLYQDGVFLYLQCSWIVQEHFEPRISFITCSNNIWQQFFVLLKNCYVWTVAVFTTNPSIVTINLHLIASDYIVQMICHWLPALPDIGTLQHKWIHRAHKRERPSSVERRECALLIEISSNKASCFTVKKKLSRI